MIRIDFIKFKIWEAVIRLLRKVYRIHPSRGKGWIFKLCLWAELKLKWKGGLDRFCKKYCGWCGYKNNSQKQCPLCGDWVCEGHFIDKYDLCTGCVK